MSDDTGKKTFTLAIRFRCLCFFVPDRKSGLMHVLMPDTTAHSAHHGNGGPSREDAADAQPTGAAHHDGHREIESSEAPRPETVDAHAGHSHGNGHGHGADRHVVRLQYPPFGDEDFIKLEGWMLEFGKGAGTAHLDLPTRTVISHESEIVQAAVADLRGCYEPISRSL